MTASHSSSVMLTSIRSRRMPGVVDQHVQVTERVDGLLHDPLGAVPRGDVVAVRLCLAAVEADLVDHLVGRTARRSRAVRLGTDVVDDDLARPAAARVRACSRPMPRPAPVTMQTLPAHIGSISFIQPIV